MLLSCCGLPQRSKRPSCNTYLLSLSLSLAFCTQRELPGCRKDLKIEYGAFQSEVSEPVSSSGLPSWTQRIFQVGNDGGEEDDDDRQPAVDPEEMSGTLWSMVCVFCSDTVLLNVLFLLLCVHIISCLSMVA